MRTSKGSDEINLPDFEFIRRVLRGDPEAVEEFLDRMTCVPRIVRMLERKLEIEFSDEQRYDASQDILLVVWKKLNSYEGRSALETWVYSLCRFEILNIVRRQRRVVNISSESGSVERVVDDSPERASALDAARAYAALEEIGSPPAEIIRLKHLEDLSFPQISERLGIAVNTAKSHYYRGISRLKEFLEPDRGEAA